MKLKYLLIGGIAIAVSSCADDALKDNFDNNVDMSDSSLKSATVMVGKNLQTRASNVDSWSMSENPASKNWEEGLSFEKPSNAINLVENPWASAAVGYIPDNFSGDINFSVANDAIIYNYGKNVTFTGGFNGKVTIYNSGEINWTVSSGLRHTIFNNSDATLIISNYANVGNVYNLGDLILKGNPVYDYSQPWPFPIIGYEKADIPNDMNIYSKKGTIEIPDGADLKAACYINNMVYVTGDLTSQNSTSEYICGIEVTGKFYLTDDNFITSYLKAEIIALNGHSIQLLPEAYVEATSKIIIPNSGSIFKKYEDSFALIKTKDIEFTDNRNFTNSFSSNIYFDITGNIVTANDGTFSLDSYIENFGDENGMLIPNISGSPACGPNYGDTPPTTVDTPFLELVAEVESHNHNSDKPNGRKLSATAVDWDGSTIYVSYHMRGGNYANDTYDDDDVEGCIETWRFNTNEQNQTIIELGNFMWTKEFDFNHILIDGNDIITVGHKEDKGAIIGRLTNEFTNFVPSFDGGETTSTELKYKYLTTDVPLYGDHFNPNQGTTTNQKVDYENAGDGNCVIRVGDNYFVATYAGYGLVNVSDFSRVKDENDNVAFVSTPGSVKHIIEKGNDEVALLYLTSRPVVTAEAQSGAEIAVLSKDAFPFGAETKPLTGFVQPVDGKNVLAWDQTNGNFFACLGKGGLNVNGEVYNFGENNGEPVNGVDFDDEYVYVAGGSHIRVLDRKSMAEVTHYTNPNMSSNFIKVIERGGEKYILAAYGQSGVKVFRLNPGK